MQLFEDVAPSDAVVKRELVQAVQLGLETEVLPPRDHAPKGQAVQLSPPNPGKQTAGSGDDRRLHQSKLLAKRAPTSCTTTVISPLTKPAVETLHKRSRQPCSYPATHMCTLLLKSAAPPQGYARWLW